LLCRTGLREAKYRNLTLFIVPLDSPGTVIEPIWTLGGERTNMTYYSDVRVSDDFRIGGVDDGWTVMREALVHERGGSLGEVPEIRSLAERCLRFAAEIGEGGLTDHQREVIARMMIHAEMTRLLDLRVRQMIVDDKSPAIEGSMTKLYSTEHLCSDVSAAMDAFGSAAVLAEKGPSLGGLLEYMYRHSVVTTIYGGTTEIQRSIIAETGLGLPRSR
jgi:alkylation response protein AidB-like acyl-CoA dehydrogenase